MKSFEMPVTVATKASILSYFHFDSVVSKIRETEAEVDRVKQPCVRDPYSFDTRLFLCAAAKYKDDTKNNQDCQEPKQIACNWDRTLKFPSLVH
jgi:hypothetical protein